MSPGHHRHALAQLADQLPGHLQPRPQPAASGKRGEDGMRPNDQQTYLSRRRAGRLSATGLVLSVLGAGLSGLLVTDFFDLALARQLPLGTAAGYRMRPSSCPWVPCWPSRPQSRRSSYSCCSYWRHGGPAGFRGGQLWWSSLAGCWRSAAPRLAFARGVGIGATVIGRGPPRRESEVPLRTARAAGLALSPVPGNVAPSGANAPARRQRRCTRRRSRHKWSCHRHPRWWTPPTNAGTPHSTHPWRCQCDSPWIP